jgi:hypothetical protein
LRTFDQAISLDVFAAVDEYEAVAWLLAEREQLEA